MRIVAIVLLGLTLLAGGARAQEAGAGWLGVELKDLTKEEADALGWEAPRGAKLVKPVPGGPAEAPGLKPDDILVSLDGVEIESVKALIETVSKKAAGTEIKLAILRAGREKRLALKLGARPAQPQRRSRGGRAAAHARHRRAYGADRGHRVYAGRQAARLGLRRQDHPRVGSGERQDRAHDPGRERAGPAGKVYAMALSPDGKWLAAGGWMANPAMPGRCGDPPLRVRERQARGAVEGACECGPWPRLFARWQQADFGKRRQHRHPLGHRLRADSRGAEPKLLHRLEGHKAESTPLASAPMAAAR